MAARHASLGFLLLLACASTAFGQASLVTINGTSSALGMTPDGRIIVGGGTGGGYYWTLEDGITWIGGFSAVAISDDGSVIFGNMEDPENPGHQVAGFWTAATGWQSIGGLPTGLLCPSRSSAYDMSADGTVAVGLAWDGCDGRAFRWTAETGMEAMEVLADGGNRASVVSADATLAGGFADGNSSSRTPAIWFADGTGMTLDPTANADGEVRGMSQDGSILVGNWDYEAFTWTFEGGLVTYEPINSGYSGVATDIADDGTLVGFDILSGQSRKAWILPPGGEITDLRQYLLANGASPVPSLDVGYKISADGRVICGHTTFQPSWVAYLYPEPECPADLDEDGTVDAADLALLLGSWGESQGHPAELNGDGFVDAADLAILLGGWGDCS